MGIIDDFKVTHTRSNVIQYNEYYPFGLQTSASWTRDNNSNNFLYNAANELNKTTGWYDTFFRGYDPSLGRFMQIDPLAQMYTDDTPYHYAGNNPVLFNDPLGDKVSGGNMFARMYDGFHAWKYGHSAEGFASWMDDAGFGGFGGEATGQGYFIGRPVEEIWMVSRYKNEDGSAGDIIDEYFDHYVYEGEVQNTIPGMYIEFSPFVENGNSGVYIRLSYKDPNSRFSDYGWIQTVRTNSISNEEIRRGIGENQPFNDGGDGTYPYYGGPTSNDIEGFDTIMADRTGRFSNSNYVTWKAEITIGGIKDGVFVPLGTLTYGYDIIDGKLDVYYPRVTEPTPWHTDSFTNKSKW